MGRVSDVGRGFGGRLLMLVIGWGFGASKVSSRKSWVLPSHNRVIAPLYRRHTLIEGQLKRSSKC